MSFADYRSFKLRDLWIERDHVSKYLREELGDTDILTPLNKRIWFTMPDGYVWIHKDVEVPASLLFKILETL